MIHETYRYLSLIAVKEKILNGFKYFSSQSLLENYFFSYKISLNPKQIKEGKFSTKILWV